MDVHEGVEEIEDDRAQGHRATVAAPAGRIYDGAMTSPDETPRPGGPDEDDDGPASTPFDNPWLLPILFTAFALWFAYDGWISEKFMVPGKEGTLAFNRWLTPVWAIAAVWTTMSALRERKRNAEGDGSDDERG